MTRFPGCWRALFALALICGVAEASRFTAFAADRVTLDRVAVVLDDDAPSYVRYGAEELAAYLKDIAGEAPSIIDAKGAKNGKQSLIIVGAKSVKALLGEDLSTESFGADGYILKIVTNGGASRIVAAGATPRGDKGALGALMKAIDADGKIPYLPADLQKKIKPPFAKRGLHFNGWPFNNPYSFRAWKEEEWKNYLDVLAYQGVNLFYLWPFIEIMPVPLSPEDSEYLAECRRLVDYAHEKHGMEVWIMQCTNRVAKDTCGVADPRLRPYWRPTQEDLNPGDPESFKAIMSSREALYRIVNNADGVCNIDSDPGYYAGSTLDDYLNVLNGCRALLDRHNVHGKQAKLIDWMWEGWGLRSGFGNRQAHDQHQALTIQTLKQKLAEPWELVAGQANDLKICRGEQALSKTIFVPYGAIEGEPAFPGTNVRIDELRVLFAKAVDPNPELLGVMGNVQTPLLQFPDVCYFTSAMSDVDSRKRSTAETLLDVSRQLYPEHAKLVADCYLALESSDVKQLTGLIQQLDDLVQRNALGRPGVFGRKLFPDHRIVAQSLVLQLKLRAARERLSPALTANATPAEVQKLLTDYGDSYLGWDHAHGWHELWGWREWQLGSLPPDPQFAAMMAGLAARLKDRAGMEACFTAVSAALAGKYSQGAIEDGYIAPVKRAVLAAAPIETLAQKATATASITPDAGRYPPSAAVDGLIGTCYWPGALVQNNSEWLQLNWDTPQTFDKVVVRFLRHPSMVGRTIHLQRETSPGHWEEFSTTVVPANGKEPNSIATFQLGAAATVDKIRIVNLLDLFEVEVY